MSGQLDAVTSAARAVAEADRALTAAIRSAHGAGEAVARIAQAAATTRATIYRRLDTGRDYPPPKAWPATMRAVLDTLAEAAAGHGGLRGRLVVRQAQEAHRTDDIAAIVRRYRLAMANLPASLDLADGERASLAVAAWIADQVERPRA